MNKLYNQKCVCFDCENRVDLKLLVKKIRAHPHGYFVMFMHFEMCWWVCCCPESVIRHTWLIYLFKGCLCLPEGHPGLSCHQLLANCILHFTIPMSSALKLILISVSTAAVSHSHYKYDEHTQNHFSFSLLCSSHFSSRLNRGSWHALPRRPPVPPDISTGRSELINFTVSASGEPDCPGHLDSSMLTFITPLLFLCYIRSCHNIFFLNYVHREIYPESVVILLLFFLFFYFTEIIFSSKVTARLEICSLHLEK